MGYAAGIIAEIAILVSWAMLCSMTIKFRDVAGW